MTRLSGTTGLGGGFSQATINQVWQKGRPCGDDPNFRLDACGACIRHDHYGQQTEYGWEIDHIKPVAKGGTDDLANLQPLHWENNRHKADNWPHWECLVRGR